MNLAYFRKSSFGLDQTVKNIKKEAEGLGLTVLGETELPGNSGKVIHLYNPNWVGNLIASGADLIGLLPCLVAVLKQDAAVTVGVGSPSVLGGVSQNPAIRQLASEVDTKLKELIHKSAGVSALKPKAVRLYSTMTCPYCKMEKEWLDSKGVKHEVIYVDLNQKEAQNMVEKTGQMGVPVTEVQFDDAEPEFIVGFDKEKLSAVLGVKETSA
ncbi:MAG: hypothetical protein M1426_01855 [Patescibacteria group bacterium]|nr:hypothetical protein [Patescibacteria group bacterium]